MTFLDATNRTLRGFDAKGRCIRCGGSGVLEMRSPRMGLSMMVCPYCQGLGHKRIGAI